jgi:preprotein translocase subunit SecA
LSYSARNADGEIEVRNQRGQLDQAASAKASQDSASGGSVLGRPAAQTAGKPSGQRGAFGQSTGPSGPAPVNRAERRAQEKRKGN